MRAVIQKEIEQSIALLKVIQHDDELLTTLEKVTAQCLEALINGNKILFAGNGGSAADAQHLAAELVCRLHRERPGLAAIALTTDTSVLTAIGNDYGYEKIFSRQIEAIGNYNDVFFAISTSGRSPNILAALKTARSKGITTVGMTGQKGHAMEELCDFVLKIPTSDTQKIQECHILLGHLICAAIEEQCCQALLKSTAAVQ